jgi:tetratricopeptide (TPR) repeat protein
VKIVAVMLYSGVDSNSYEEEMIVRCLESLQGFVDGIVMVDTGGTEKIIEVAADYAVKLFHSPWTNDFSFHRNEALDYALAEYPDEDLWWFTVDPDEELIEPDIGYKVMRERIAKLPEEAAALAVTIHEINMKGDRTTGWRGLRFFRKSTNLRYRNIVHNKPIIDGNAAMTNIEMHHYGYSHNKNKLREKWARTNVALKMQIAEDPYDHRTCYYLSQNSASLRRYEEAIFWGIRCMQYFPYPDDPSTLNFYGSIYYVLGMAYARIGDGNEAWRWLQHGLKLFPEDLDLNFAMALIAARAVRKDLFTPHAEKYLQLLENHRKPDKLKTFMGLMPKEDNLERNVHHIGSQSEADVRRWIEHWDELEEEAA